MASRHRCELLSRPVRTARGRVSVAPLVTPHQRACGSPPHCRPARWVRTCFRSHLAPAPQRVVLRRSTRMVSMQLPHRCTHIANAPLLQYQLAGARPDISPAFLVMAAQFWPRFAPRASVACGARLECRPPGGCRAVTVAWSSCCSQRVVPPVRAQCAHGGRTCGRAARRSPPARVRPARPPCGRRVRGSFTALSPAAHPSAPACAQEPP